MQNYWSEMNKWAVPNASMPYSADQQALNEYFSRGSALGKTFSEKDITSALGGVRGAELENQYRSWAANKQYLEHAREFNLNMLEQQRQFDAQMSERNKDRSARKWGGIASTALQAGGLAAGIMSGNPFLAMGAMQAGKMMGGMGSGGGGDFYGTNYALAPPSYDPSSFNYDWSSYNYMNQPSYYGNDFQASSVYGSPKYWDKFNVSPYSSDFSYLFEG